MSTDIGDDDLICARVVIKVNSCIAATNMWLRQHIYALPLDCIILRLTVFGLVAD